MFEGTTYFVCAGVHPMAASDPLIIVGGVLLGLVALVIIVIFLAYLRRVFARKDRVSMSPLESGGNHNGGNHIGPTSNGGTQATFVNLEETQLVSSHLI